MPPSEADILAQIAQICTNDPDLGKERILAKLNADNGWDISSKDFRSYMAKHDKMIEEENLARAIYVVTMTT